MPRARGALVCPLPSRAQKREPIAIWQPVLRKASRIRGTSLRIMLAVAVHPNDIVEAQLESQFVACLHAPAQPQMRGQREHVRSRGQRDAAGGIAWNNRPPPAPRPPASPRALRGSPCPPRPLRSGPESESKPPWPSAHPSQTRHLPGTDGETPQEPCVLFRGESRAFADAVAFPEERPYSPSMASQARKT